MKTVVEGFLIAGFLFSLCGGARSETMEARKQRLMRKYLREPQSIQQSGLDLPRDALENERIMESEKFKDPQPNMTRQGRSMASRMMAPVPVQQAQRNWLLQDDELTEDPYADPFAMDSSEETVPNRSESWAQLLQQREERAAAREAARTPSYDYGTVGSYEGDRQRGYDYTRQQDRMDGDAYQRGTGSGYGYTAPSAGRLDPYETTGLGSSPSGMLQLPDPNRRSADDPQSSTVSGYVPYRSPYEMQREQQRLQSSPQPEEQEFIRTTPYQRWKEQNQTWDPTADDAYLNDLMNPTRR